MLLKATMLCIAGLGIWLIRMVSKDHFDSKFNFYGNASSYLGKNGISVLK